MHVVRGVRACRERGACMLINVVANSGAVRDKDSQDNTFVSARFVIEFAVGHGILTFADKDG